MSGSGRDTTYYSEYAWPGYVPKVTYNTFLNESTDGDGTPVALLLLIATTGYCPMVPGNPALDDIPMVEPERDDEEIRTQGDGLNVGSILDKGWKDGSASKKSQCVFGIHLKDTIGLVEIADITRDVAEISTVLFVADVAKSLDGKYFRFDVVDAHTPYIIKKYHVWFKVDVGTDPDPDGSTAIEAAITENDTGATIAGIVKLLIDALDDCTCTVSSATITITNDTEGAVDNAHDVDAGVSCTTSTDGVSTKSILESSSLTNIGIHNNKEKTDEDIYSDILGITQLEYALSCEMGGTLEEERGYLSAWAITGGDLARPRGPDGLKWTSNGHPYLRYKRNFNWGNCSFTFTYNETPVECRIESFNFRVSITVDYKRDGGSIYSNEREIKSRDYELTLTIRATGSMLRTISRTFINDYDGDLLFTMKAQRGADTNDYISVSLDKLRLLPIPQNIPVGSSYESFDIVLHAAPGCTFTGIIKGYLSQQYYGVN